MKNSSISFRLTLLVLVPLMALVFCSALLIMNSSREASEAKETGRLMQISVAAGELIHTLQSERGATAGFIQSSGAKFADKLPGLRKGTDEKLSVFKGYLNSALLGELPELASCMAKLDALEAMRGQADKLSIPAKDSTSYFTETIAALIKVVDASGKSNSDPALSRKLSAYQVFVRAKENAGQERAMSMPVFVADKVELQQLRAILDKVDAQSAYLQIFRSFAADEHKAELEQLLQGSESKEVERLRSLMYLQAASGGFGVDSAHWFATISTKINGMHAIERKLSDDILAAAEKKISDENRWLVLYSVLAMVAVLTTVVAGYWVGGGISRPLRQVVETAEYAVSQNDFTKTVPTDGPEEVARTALAFNGLIGKFAGILRESARYSEEISAASTRLANASTEASKGADLASDSTSMVASSMEEISASVSETTRNTDVAREYVLKSKEETNQALDVMERAVKNIDAISRLIARSSERVGILSESSQRIGGIIQVIRDIADQTNLLALNAAIEAARAGEHGRGFAVVADEVRKLAERTASSTNEIASLVDDIQTQISDAVTSMASANTEADKNRALASESETALKAMENNSDLIAAQVMNIVSAIKEQDQGVQQVSGNIDRIAEISQQSSRLAHENSSTSQSLEMLAAQLKSAVQRFTV